MVTLFTFRWRGCGFCAMLNHFVLIIISSLHFLPFFPFNSFPLLFCSNLFSSLLIYSILIYSILFHSILFYFIIFHFALPVLFHSILLYSSLFYFALFFTTKSHGTHTMLKSALFPLFFSTHPSYFITFRVLCFIHPPPILSCSILSCSVPSHLTLSHSTP